MVTWAFIFLSDGCSAEAHHTVLDHSGDRLLVFGVGTIEEGVAVAKRITDENGCILIELCGGFGADGAARVIEAVGGKAGVGYVEYLPGEREKFRALRNARQQSNF